MSRIVRFSVYSHCNDLGGKLWNPAIRWTQKHAVFVVLEDEDGFSGLGECWCFDTAPDPLVAFLRTELAPRCMGLSIGQYKTLVDELTVRATLTARHGMLASAISGIDIAVWDIRSQRAQQPLWSFINPDSDGHFRLYGSGGLYSKDKDSKMLTAEMEAMSKNGFDIVKMKVGGLTLSEDLERIKSVLNALPESCRLIIDGVYSYSVEQTLLLFNSLPAARIEAFQAPIAAKDIQGMKNLVAKGVPVMASEAEYREEIHCQFVAERAVHYLQTAPIACGGLTRLHTLSELVESSRVRLSLEVSSTAVATLAACHFAAADPQVAHVEYHHIHQVFFDRLEMLATPGKKGLFTLEDKPGLGITLPLSDVVEEYSTEHAILNN